MLYVAGFEPTRGRLPDLTLTTLPTMPPPPSYTWKSVYKQSYLIPSIIPIHKIITTNNITRSYTKMSQQYKYLSTLNLFYSAVTCPENYEIVGVLCYKLIASSSPEPTFLDALATCNTEGSGLAHPTNISQLNKLAEFIANNVDWSAHDVADVAIGLNVA
ncbi:hypothetical protein E2C01_088292 [Portunus trituberculatus]|uniref:Uncharacterized protein n=1 Tax=Portunus trituberculatus TaxID=210409 RepID=A0A5B7J8U1_PORTR|nr:hypothetical protein [Portunus trituberculatus]